MNTPILLTKEVFDKIPDDQIFKIVTTRLQTVHESYKAELTFVCKKGQANDWAIYCHYSSFDIDYIKDHGDKVASDFNILSICPCTDEVLYLYRK